MRTLISILICALLPLGAEATSPIVDGVSAETHAPLKIALDPGKKALVLVFLSVKCPCSRSHVAEVRKLAKDYPQFQFVAVHSNTDENRESTQEYFKAQDLGFPVVQDEGAKIANEWKALKTPHVFVVGAQGEVFYKGGVSDSAKFEKASKFYLREALADLAQDKPVRTSETRVLGCAIERGENADVWKK